MSLPVAVNFAVPSVSVPVALNISPICTACLVPVLVPMLPAAINSIEPVVALSVESLVTVASPVVIPPLI